VKQKIKGEKETLITALSTEESAVFFCANFWANITKIPFTFWAFGAILYIVSNSAFSRDSNVHIAQISRPKIVQKD